ncbi:hypothetical protein BJ912DRAFT_400382 [Pholiota molesta]|nr:hypothetical protein BJ912DRAFT_400382 [Pholiota molesta]
MLSLLLRPRLYRSFRQLDLGPAPELNSWCLIPCALTSTLGKRMLATSTEKIPKRAPHIDSPSSFRLRTLRPERLSIVGQEVIDLSGKTASLVPTLIDGRVLRLQCHYTRNRHLHGRNRYLRYPENTRGVFYYHNPPDGPEFYAGMRFRICDSAAEFEHGRDLLDSRGDVWGPKILELVKHKELQGFLSLLRAENLIDEDLINDIKKLDYLARAGRHVGNVHYSLFEPFYMNVAQSKSQLTYVTRAKLVRLHFPGRIFTVQTHPASSKPLTGQACYP